MSPVDDSNGLLLRLVWLTTVLILVGSACLASPGENPPSLRNATEIDLRRLCSQYSPPVKRNEPPAELLSSSLSQKIGDGPALTMTVDGVPMRVSGAMVSGVARSLAARDREAASCYCAGCTGRRTTEPVTLAWDIGIGGAAENIRVRGESGCAGVGLCLAGVVEGIVFPVRSVGATAEYIFSPMEDGVRH